MTVIVLLVVLVTVVEFSVSRGRLLGVETVNWQEGGVCPLSLPKQCIGLCSLHGAETD